ncbi:MAG TPA: GNAT family N-acetyltransferase [Ilumatobacteraceae bacterium]
MNAGRAVDDEGAAVVLRDASSGDEPTIAVIAEEGNASADSGYLALLRSQGARVVVAETDGAVVGFGSVVEIGQTAMLTDLFVAATSRGDGVGTRLLNELFAQHIHRMTFSSKHPAASSAYLRAGMEPRWRLLYLEGVVTGGGAPLVAAAWRHDRSDLVSAFAANGAVVMADAVVIPTKRGSWLARLQSDGPIDVVRDIFESLPAGSAVTLCVPEHSVLCRWLLENGFAIIDHDTFFATRSVDLPADLHCIHPGLA